MDKLDEQELEQALRVVINSAYTTNKRSSDGTMHSIYHYASPKVTTLLRIIGKHFPEIMENAKKPSLESIEQVKNAIEQEKDKKNYFMAAYSPQRVEHLENVLEKMETEYAKRTDIQQ